MEDAMTFRCEICGDVRPVGGPGALAAVSGKHRCLALNETMATRIEAHRLLQQIKPDPDLVIRSRRRALLADNPIIQPPRKHREHLYES